MNYTNKNNLPSAFVNACKEEDGHELVEGVYHVTDLINPTEMTILKRRHDKEITQDVSDCVWLIFGKAVHSLMEKNDKTGFAEYSVEAQITPKSKLVGRIDLYNEKDQTIEDYKTATVFKIIMREFDDWKLQGLMYAWLMKQKGVYIKGLRFHAILKDFSERNKRLALVMRKTYPDSPVYTWEYQITAQDMVDIEKYIHDKIAEYESLSETPDDKLPTCSTAERWNEGDKYAVMVKGFKRAIKVCDTPEEADEIAKANDGYVQVRHSEDKRCRCYCLAREYCPYFKNVLAQYTAEKAEEEK